MNTTSIKEATRCNESADPLFDFKQLLKKSMRSDEEAIGMDEQGNRPMEEVIAEMKRQASGENSESKN